MPKRIAAFSLIELLTVIAIIAILAAILIPVVGRVRKQAQLANCISNIRQWGAANLLHANDHSGLIPWDGWDGSSNSSPQNMTEHMGTLPWFNALPPYFGSASIRELAARGSLPRLGDNSLFICPSAEKVDNSPDWLCYGPNYLLSYSTPSAVRVGITHLDMIREPNRVPLFAETTNHAPGSAGIAALNANPRYLAEAPRHDQAPIVFFDGHVEVFPPPELILQYRAWDNSNFPQRVRWNPLHQ